jgi:hypothetical protein
MEISLIGDPRVVENTLFMSSRNAKMWPLFFVTVSKLMHHSNLVRKRAGPSAEFTELNTVISPVQLMLFLLIHSGFATVPL